MRPRGAGQQAICTTRKGVLMVAESFKRLHKIIALCVALAFASTALALGFAVTADAQEEGGSTPQPTVQGDNDDYPPGGTVVLTGSSWQPGESVNIVDDDGADERDWQHDVTVTADENGNIRDEFQLPNWFVANYTVKATGARLVDEGTIRTYTYTITDD